MDYITILTTEGACNKSVTLNPDGSLTKNPAGSVYSASACTVYVPDLPSFKATLDNISRTTNQTMTLGYVPGTEDGVPFRVSTKKNLDQWEADPQYENWEHGIIHNGVKYTARTKKHFHFSSWMVFDKDSVEGMPAHLDHADPITWWSAMCELVPGLRGCGYVFVPSTSSRILLNGNPAYPAGGWHFYVQVNDARDINRFGTELLVHSLGTDYGFMRELYDSTTHQVIGHRPWTIFDPTTFTQERLVFEGCPVVEGGLTVADSQILTFQGTRLNTALLHVTDADAQLIEAKTGYRIEMKKSGTGMSCSLLNDGDLHLDTVIDTEVGPMTVQQFWDSDHDRLRCQAVFRPDSTSMAAYLNRHTTGEPFLFDVGTHTKFTLNKEETFFREVAAIQARQVANNQPSVAQTTAPPAAPALPPPDLTITPFQQLANAADRLGVDDREQAVELYMMALELGPLEADDLVKHHLTLWNKSTIEKAARAIRGRRREQAIEYNRQAEMTAGGFSLLATPPSTPMTEVIYFLSRHIYIAAEAAWYDRHTGTSLRSEGFNHMHRHLMQDYFPEKVMADLPLPRPTDVFSDSHLSVKVNNRTYWPGVSNEIVTCDNQVSLNSWKPSTFQTQVEAMQPVSEQDVLPWLDLVEYLIPNLVERTHVLDHIAFMMQHQDRKINHCILLGGEERIGKDTIFLPLMKFIGEMNSSVIDAARLDEPFSDWLVCVKLAILEEIHKSNYKDARGTENQMKPKLASPPEVLRIPRKGQVDMVQPNLVQFVAFTNYRDALHLSSDGARYFCVWSNAERRSQEYYAGLYAWLEAGGAYWVARWLLDRDVSQFDAKGPAPTTEWREEMAQEGKSDMEKELLEVVEDWKLAGVEYFTSCQLSVELIRRHPGVRNGYRTQSISRALNNLRVPKVHGNREHRLWVPAIFFNYDGLPVTEESFKARTMKVVYLTDLTRRGVVEVNHTDVKMALCPRHMAEAYGDYIAKWGGFVD